MNFDQNVFNLPTEERKLIAAFRKLDKAGRRSLRDYADWLVERGSEEHESPQATQRLEPADIPRPQEESVVKAIRRLTKTYHMVDKNQLFNETSSLMTQHVIQGKEAELVIDELEEVFLNAYKKLRDKAE